MHNVPVLHDIAFSLQPIDAVALGFLHRADPLKVVEADDLGTHKAAGQIGVNLGRSLHGIFAFGKAPRPALIFSHGEEDNQPHPLVNGPQNLGAELVYLDRTGEVVQPRSGKTMPPKFMAGPVAPVLPGQDRRQVLADWLASAKNPFFAKSVANRVWFHLTGRGIVDPVDDFRDSNPSANDELLDALAQDFAAHKFDLKQLVRVILNSRTYQLSAQANDFNKDDNKYFSHAVTKLLTAEQLLDALCTVTESPEKFQNIPLGTRAVQLPDGEINHPFLKTFGQPGRELACECEREQDSNLAQALQLINGPTVNDKLRNAKNRIGRLGRAHPRSPCTLPAPAIAAADARRRRAARRGRCANAGSGRDRPPASAGRGPSGASSRRQGRR